MSFLDKLTEKSWEPAGAAAAATAAAGPASRHAAQKTALGIFLVIISVVFLLFFLTFITHSQYPGFEALAGEPWMPFSNTSQLWLNTLFLGLSSAALHAALVGARRGMANFTILAMVAAVFFAIQFVLAQLWLWRDLTAMGYGLAENPANSYFYLLTAVHGLHLLGGLVVLFRATLLLWQGQGLERIQASLSLCATYWHYLLGLWLVLFALMASSPETYQTIAALCGLEG